MSDSSSGSGSRPDLSDSCSGSGSRPNLSDSSSGSGSRPNLSDSPPDTSAAAAWAGIIVRDLETSAAWYRDVLPVVDTEQGHGWVAFNLDGGSCVELHAGDPEKPGLVFPSYGADPGPPVMPGLSVLDPVAASSTLEVMRVFPDWMVVAAGDGLRLVLTDREVEPGRGLVGFAFASPDPLALSAVLSHVGFDAVVQRAVRLEVVPLVASNRDCDLVDPDGTVLRLTTGA